MNEMIGLPNGPSVNTRLRIPPTRPENHTDPEKRDEEMQYQAAKLSGHSIKHILDYTEKPSEDDFPNARIFDLVKTLSIILRGEGESLTYNGYMYPERDENREIDFDHIMRILGDLSTLRIESKITPGGRNRERKHSLKEKLKYLFGKIKKTVEPNSTFVDYVVLYEILMNIVEAIEYFLSKLPADTKLVSVRPGFIEVNPETNTLYFGDEAYRLLNMLHADWDNRLKGHCNGVRIREWWQYNDERLEPEFIRKKIIADLDNHNPFKDDIRTNCARMEGRRFDFKTKHCNLINDGSSVYGSRDKAQSGGGRCVRVRRSKRGRSRRRGKKGVLKKEKRATKRSRH